MISSTEQPPGVSSVGGIAAGGGGASSGPVGNAGAGVDDLHKYSRLWTILFFLVVLFTVGVFGIWQYTAWGFVFYQFESHGAFYFDILSRDAIFNGISGYRWKDIQSTFEDSGNDKCADMAGKFVKGGNAATVLGILSNIVLGLYFLALFARRYSSAIQARLDTLFYAFIATTTFFLFITGIAYASSLPTDSDWEPCHSSFFAQGQKFYRFDLINVGPAVVHCFVVFFVWLPITVFLARKFFALTRGPLRNTPYGYASYQ